MADCRVLEGRAEARSGGGQVGSVRRTRCRQRSSSEASELSKLTGERPLQGVTPDSLIALHDAGYRAVVERLGPGLVLDVGCGAGFESARMAAPGRRVIGVDYDVDAVTDASARFGSDGLLTAAADANRLPVASGTFDYVCSSHLIEHFAEPHAHVAELARVLGPGGTAFVVTPNAPADFENPFHIRLFRQRELASALEERFANVTVFGLDASDEVKSDFEARRARAAKVLRLDVLGLRRRLPRSWYIAAYQRMLPLAYRLLARSDSGGDTGITSEQFFVVDPRQVDDSTLVLFAVARSPRHEPQAGGGACSPSA